MTLVMRPSWRAAVSTVVAVKVPGTAASPGELAACRSKSPSVAVIGGPGEQFADARRMLDGALAHRLACVLRGARGGGRQLSWQARRQDGESIRGLVLGHPAGVLGHQGPGFDLAVVGDDGGGLLAAQAGDDQLADGSRVACQLHGVVLAYLRV